MPAKSVRCPAKVNLGLLVADRAADGYHALHTVFQTIALFDELDIEVTAGGRAGIHLECDQPELATNDNLAARAAESVLKETGRRRSVKIRLRKRIPAGAGLGGGSSDAAGVLRVLPSLLGSSIALARLMELGSRLGADVPFFLLGGQVVGLGRGTELFPLPDSAAVPVVVVHPDVHVSTAEAYRRLDDMRAAAREEPRPRVRRANTGQGRPPTLTTALEDPMIFYFCASVYRHRWDRLRNEFEPVVFSAYPDLARLKGVLIRAGASPALLCGSGSAVFGLFDSGDSARAAAARVRARWPEWRVWVTRTVSRKKLSGDGFKWMTD